MGAGTVVILINWLIRGNKPVRILIATDTIFICTEFCNEYKPAGLRDQMSYSTNHIIHNTGSFLLVLLFEYTGFSKLLEHNLFVFQIMSAGFLQTPAIFISVALPMLEIAAGVLIAFHNTALLGWWLSAMLMTAFTLYVSMMLLSKSSLPCTCGGVIASMTWRQHLYFNIFFMLLSWGGVYHLYKNKIISTNKGSKLKTLE